MHIFYMKYQIRDFTKTVLKPIRFGGKLTMKLLKGHKNRQTGKWVHDELISLGPTYIKIGQIVSSRPDLFPDYITSELQALQDNVPPFNYDEVEKILTNELEYPVNHYFSSFTKEPVASASIAQVHKAVLRTSNIQVAVKVQRPGIKKNFSRDLQFINNIFVFLSKFDNKNISDLLLILKECTNAIEQEVDFNIEKSNMMLFYRIFHDNENIQIPRVYSRLTTSKVIVMEYIESFKINDITRINNPVDLSKDLMYTFITATLNNGIIHGDPHPGNIGITETGKIVLYDFGIISRFDKDIQQTFKSILKAILRNDIENIMQLLIASEIIFTIPLKTSINELNSSEYIILYKLVTYILDYTKTLDIHNLTQSIINDEDIDQKNIPFTFNSNMILLFKTMTTLEGICKTLNGNFTYSDILMDMATDYIDGNFIMDKMNHDVNNIMTQVIPETVDNDKIKSLKFKKLESKIDDQIKLIWISVYVSIIHALIIH